MTTYPVGSILLIEKYKLPTKEKDKYFIVLGEDGRICNWVSITTSKFYLAQELIKHGVINQESYASMYCFEREKVIGRNGFSFPKNTFISHNSNILEFSVDKFSEYTIKVKDRLTNRELKNLLNSFYQYRGTSKKNKILLKKILDNL